MAVERWAQTLSDRLDETLVTLPINLSTRQRSVYGTYDMTALICMMSHAQVGVTFAPPDGGIDAVLTSSAAAGLAWRDAPGAPMTTSSLIPGGSTIKAFTATSAMALVDRGLLDIDRPVSIYQNGRNDV